MLLWRLRPLNRSEQKLEQRLPVEPVSRQPLVSIIIPARNEEKNLPLLLESIKKLTYPKLEVIVVDDHSSDRTFEVARSFGVQVISSAPLPEKWNGKNWACHQGALQASGDFLLFTDADTSHRPDSVERALRFFNNSRADLISALPYHRTETFWEKWMGPFHALVYVATTPNRPRLKRLFAVGQYLLFSKGSYRKLGGHEAVASKYPDDLSLANLCLKSGGTYSVHTGRPLFDVRLYDSFRAAVNGWRRNFLAGIQKSRIQATAEVILAIFALTGSGRAFDGALTAVPAVLSWLVILVRQRSFGDFSAVGVLVIPFSLALYCWVTVLALFDFASGNTLVWKERSYQGWLK